MSTLRLTMAQALVRYLAAQRTVFEGAEVPLFAGVFAIFGHGNVAGLGEALQGYRDRLPTFRAHNEQAMAHAAIAFAKACNRRRMMACTSSIGPGATNMVTAAALAHVNRLPVLLLPATSSPTAGPTRCSSRSRTRATPRSRPTTASGPCPATGPDQPPRTDPEQPARGLGDFDGPGPLRSRHLGPAPGRAGRIL